MDLELGLALPTNPTTLNSCDFDSDDLFTSFPIAHNNSSDSHKKCSFSDLFHHNTDDVLLPTLPLLPLTPSHEADLDDHNTSCSVVTKNEGDDHEESAAAGWPPIMSQRKKFRFEGDGMVGIRHKRAGSVDPIRESNALYVKVSMEGEGIGRKVDLSLHHSFQKLKETLITMFGKCRYT